MKKLLAAVTAVFFCFLSSSPAALSPDCGVLLPKTVQQIDVFTRCTVCHKRLGVGPRTENEIDHALCRRSPALINQMIDMARGELGSRLTQAEIALLRARSQEYAAAKSKTFAQKTPRVVLLSAAQQAQQMALIPGGDPDDPSGLFLRLLKSSGPVFYDTSVFPRIVQSEPIGAAMALQDVAKVSRSRKDTSSSLYYFDRGGLEFPWLHAAATDELPAVETFRFFLALEPGPMLETFRVSRRHKEMYSDFSNETDRLYGFTFLPGTVFGEVLTMKSPQGGAPVPFEVRLRHVKKDGAWDFDVLRPFPTRASLVAEVERRVREGNASTGLVTFLASIRAAPALKKVDYRTEIASDTLKRNSMAAMAFASEAAVDVLPPLDPADVRTLLETTPFRSSMGMEWARAGTLAGFAPRGSSAFHLTPAGYLGTHLRTFSSQCIRCHSDTQSYVKRFDPKKGTIGTTDGSAREWYAHMPGSTPQKGPYGLGDSGVISFHPFSASSVVSDIFSTRPAKVNAEILGAGLVRETTEER